MFVSWRQDIEVEVYNAKLQHEELKGEDDVERFHLQRKGRQHA